MKQHRVNTQWKGKMAFDSHIENHTVRIDASGDLGDDSGPNPKPLLLSSLAGCTGMDVVELLRKMRVDFTALDIEIEANVSESKPEIYTHIRLLYRFAGPDLKARRDKVEKAVRLSQEKMCGVTAMLLKNCPVTYTMEIADQPT